MGIHSVELDSNGKNIISMCSLEGESVNLVNHIDISQPVEVNLEKKIKMG